MLKELHSIGRSIKFWFLIGMPASTKTTTGRIIYELIKNLNPNKLNLTWAYYETSSLIREAIRQKTSIGQILAQQSSRIDAGSLASDQPVMGLIEQQTLSDHHKGVINFFGDGCTRNIKQAKAFTENAQVKWEVLYFETPEALSRERLARRAMKAGRPNEAKPDVVEMRMGEYAGQTFPVLEFLRGISRKRIHTIYATTEIRKRVKEALIAMGFEDRVIKQMLIDLHKEDHPAHLIMMDALRDGPQAAHTDSANQEQGGAVTSTSLTFVEAKQSPMILSQR